MFLQYFHFRLKDLDLDRNKPLYFPNSLHQYLIPVLENQQLVIGGLRQVFWAVTNYKLIFMSISRNSSLLYSWLHSKSLSCACLQWIFHVIILFVHPTNDYKKTLYSIHVCFNKFYIKFKYWVGLFHVVSQRVSICFTHAIGIPVCPPCSLTSTMYILKGNLRLPSGSTVEDVVVIRSWACFHLFPQAHFTFLRHHFLWQFSTDPNH